MTKSIKHCLESLRFGNLNNFYTEWRKSIRFEMRSEQNSFFEIQDPRFKIFSILPMPAPQLHGLLFVHRADLFQAVTIFEGGVKVNVVPSEARAFINYRIHPAQTIDDVIENCRDAIDDDRVTVRVVESFVPSRVTDYSSDAVPFQIVVNSALEVKSWRRRLRYSTFLMTFLRRF